MAHELTREHAFVGYPQDYVLGIFQQMDSVEAAVTGLIEAGFNEAQLLVLSRPSDTKDIDKNGTEHGVLTTAERTVQELGDKDTLDEYAKALTIGMSVIGAHAEDAGQREQANHVMRRAGGQSIRFFGRFVVEDLDTAPDHKS